MRYIIATSNIFEGEHYEIKKGEIGYFEHGDYHENWQCWTIVIYKRIRDTFKQTAILPEGDFATEIQRMHDLKSK